MPQLTADITVLGLMVVGLCAWCLDGRHGHSIVWKSVIGMPRPGGKLLGQLHECCDVQQCVQNQGSTGRL